MQGGRIVDPFGRRFEYNATAYLRERNKRDARKAKGARVSEVQATAFLNPS